MKYVKAFLGIFNTIIGYWLGGFDEMLIALLVFMICDYLTGVMKAIIKKKVSSEIGFKGIFKKVLILFLVGIAVRLDIILNLDDVLRYLVISFYIANEGISILENAGEMGLPFPKKLKEVLVQLNNEEKEDEK